MSRLNFTRSYTLKPFALLTTAQVYIYNNLNVPVLCRALLNKPRMKSALRA